jgi:penicillin-binding protein 1A
VLTARRLRLGRTGGRGSAARVVAITVLVLGFATVVGAAVAAGKAVQVALHDCTFAGRAQKAEPITSFVYARDGYSLGAIPATLHRQPVAYSAISPWVREATVAAEDHTFWANDGLDYASIARAALADVSAGREVQGASTITQQLVRSLYLNDDKTFARKRLEACLALKLTKSLTKPQILTMYLHRIPYGHHALGIEAAARTYFGVPASRLGPDQAAFLAGLPQAPSAYDPSVHSWAARTRRNEVLRAMRNGGSLSTARYRQLVRRKLNLHPGHGYRVIRMPNFFSYVESQLIRAYGRREVEGGGLHVYTTVDPREQTFALNTMRSTLGRPGDPASALVSIDPHSGAIRALASSWHGHELQFDLPADGARQTGSAFKPFVLTDAVWLHHADPQTTWYDSSKFTYQPTAQSKPWTPRTYENRYFGPETLFKATLLSDNVVYAKLTLDLGPASVARVAHLMGITSPLQVVPSIGLGSNSVTPLVLASAYATLASGGVYHAPYAIRKVVLSDGTVDSGHHWGPNDVHRVLPPGVAWTVTKVLQANVREGTGVRAQLPGRQAAGKTGTTTRWTDAWFAGFVPTLTTVTWVGYPLHTRSMSDVHGIEVQGGSFPAEIWHGYMTRALAGSPHGMFHGGGWVLRPYRGPRSMRGHRP